MQGRGVLSCSSCRQRKLRCDRQDPCSNCIARSVDCSYSYPSAPRTRNTPRASAISHRDGAQTKNLEARLRHLEQLLGNMASQQAPPPSSSSQSQSQSPPSSVSDSVATHSDSQPFVATNEQVKPGRVFANDGEVVYVSGSHWQAICNEVSSIKEHLDREGSDSPMHASGSSQDGPSPYLFVGTGPMPDLHDILSDIPPQNVTDRLVYRYFHKTDPFSVMLHAPTFQHEYTKFWHDPHAVALPWLATLFGIMALGARSEEVLPGALAEMKPADVIDVFHRRNTDCLMLSRYSCNPTTYTLEALLFNIALEMLKRPDVNLGPWVLGGVVVRLAMRMGYHRDPDQYVQFSPFQGEMRRRVWCHIMQLDTMGSSLLGLPSIIQEFQHDTRLPLNLLDEDFGPETVQLPPGRPDTEVTPILYAINKTVLMLVYRTIFDQVSLGRVDAYDEIMALERRLHQAHEAISPRFRMASLEHSIVAPPALITRGFTLEILFLKSRCTLHRHHMTKAYRDPSFNFSRTACVESAMEMLRYQSMLLREMQEGGTLQRERWLLSTVEQQNFLMASMIVCVELSHRGRPPGENLTSPGRSDQGFLRYTRENLVAALQGSYQFWTEFFPKSAEARQACELLTVILDKFGSESGKKTDDAASSCSGTFVGTEMSDALPSVEAEFAPLCPELGQFGMLLDTPEILDWNSWEAFIQNPQAATEL